MLQGEGVEYLGHASDAIIAISNYRLHIKFKDSVINVSFGCTSGSLFWQMGSVVFSGYAWKGYEGTRILLGPGCLQSNQLQC